MATKGVSKKLVSSTAKIAAVGNFLLNEDGQNVWSIDEIHLTSREISDNEKVICKWVKENGKWVLRCKKA
jgi:hypothetical protein